MINPYRQSARVAEDIKIHKPRPWYKTLYLKYLIRKNGKFMERFKRCHKCNKVTCVFLNADYSKPFLDFDCSKGGPCWSINPRPSY